MPCDLGDLIFKVPFTDRSARLCSMFNPVDQDLLFIACECLLFLLSAYGWLMQLKKMRTKSIMGNIIFPLLKKPVAVDVLFVADCEQTRQRVIGGSNGVDTSENVDYLYYVGT